MFLHNKEHVKVYVYYAFLASTVWVMASLRHVFFVSIFLFWAFCDALPPYIPALSAGLQNNRDACIIQYFSLGFGYVEILGFLSFFLWHKFESSSAETDLTKE